MDSVIDLLRNDSEYYNGEGKKYLSNSDIGVLLRNPREYGVKREDNKNFAEGRYFHQLLIEPDKATVAHFVEASTRNTKLYKDYCAENDIPFCMLQSEKEEMERLASIMKQNIYFFDEIYKDGNVYEQPAIGEIKGRMWKGKADIITDEVIIDLKTTSDIHKFKYSAKAYNYDSQAYIYQQLFGKPLIFFVIDKLTGQLGIFRPTENFLLGGERKVEKAIDVYDTFFGDNQLDEVDNHYIDETLD
jgi:hypothetical protein